MSGIVFQVETERVLQILAREIYDSPLALLRENVQNAYDAVRMRFAPDGNLLEGGTIDVRIEGGSISVEDNGVGMSEDILRNNFWKAGASGKNTDAAKRAGVVGTFGIGAMANFGVATALTVETETESATDRFVSSAKRDSLKLAEECVELSVAAARGACGTKVTAVLDTAHPISVDAAKRYLRPYVASLPVPVTLNGDLISQQSLAERAGVKPLQRLKLGDVELSDGQVKATFSVEVDSNGRVVVWVTDILFGGNPVNGSLILLQSSGQLMGLRSSFGLAPAPVPGCFSLGGVADLPFLQPTAGREALSRESIAVINRFVVLAERAAAERLSQTKWADVSTAFLQWVVNNRRFDLAKKVTVRVHPQDADVALGDLKDIAKGKQLHYYAGTDKAIVNTFANESALLAQLAQTAPRRAVQLHVLAKELNVILVPNDVQVLKEFTPLQLTMPEAAILVRVSTVLRDDYLVMDVEPRFCELSHGVSVLVKKDGNALLLYMDRRNKTLPAVIEMYESAYDLFGQFMKDFVRVQIFQHIQEHVPSSTRQGVDALRTLLKRNRELYRYEESELGDLEGVLGDFLGGTASFAAVLQESRSRASSQTQRVTLSQVGTVEAVLPDVVQTPVQHGLDGFGLHVALPPILREESSTSKKLLTTKQRYGQLNGFTALLGLSDRLMRTEAPFFRAPHTTRIMWGGHRIIYIFTESTGRLSLYYDIELRAPVDQLEAGGSPFQTTTVITKNRIFVPIPEILVEQFAVASGPREFFVRFDILSSET